MRIVIGSDHRGYRIRNSIIELLTRMGHEVEDVGTDSGEPVDYVDFAAIVAKKVSDGSAERGILVGGTGLGMCVAADKFKGVRAAPCHDEMTAEMSRRHNDLNVMCLSADLLGERLIKHMVEVWIETPFDGGRHATRLARIAEIEDEIRAERKSRG